MTYRLSKAPRRSSRAGFGHQHRGTASRCQTEWGDSLIALDPTEYRIVIALAGLAFVLAAWVPAYTARRPLSLPIVLVGAGAALFALPNMPDVDPTEHLELTEHLTEFGVIIALLGAGLKIDRPLGLWRWATTWRLLAVAMPLSIAGTAVFGWTVVGLAPASALLLGAVLAPTDPVLAADVQVGEPSLEGEHRGRRHQPGSGGQSRRGGHGRIRHDRRTGRRRSIQLDERSRAQ